MLDISFIAGSLYTFIYEKNGPQYILYIIIPIYNGNEYIIRLFLINIIVHIIVNNIA